MWHLFLYRLTEGTRLLYILFEILGHVVEVRNEMILSIIRRCTNYEVLKRGDSIQLYLLLGV